MSNQNTTKHLCKHLCQGGYVADATNGYGVIAVIGSACPTARVCDRVDLGLACAFVTRGLRLHRCRMSSRRVSLCYSGFSGKMPWWDGGRRVYRHAWMMTTPGSRSRRTGVAMKRRNTNFRHPRTWSGVHHARWMGSVCESGPARPGVSPRWYARLLGGGRPHPCQHCPDCRHRPARCRTPGPGTWATGMQAGRHVCMWCRGTVA